LERSPAAGGAEAIAAPGGDGASIAQMYILRACRGIPPVPDAACGRKIIGHGPQEGVYPTRKLTYEQAKSFIRGEEPFDKQEWERQHILRLRDSVEKALLEIAPCYYENLRKTCARYIENHKDTPNLEELNALIETYAKIVQAAGGSRIEEIASDGKQTSKFSKKVKRNRKTSFSR